MNNGNRFFGGPAGNSSFGGDPNNFNNMNNGMNPGMNNINPGMGMNPGMGNEMNMGMNSGMGNEKRSPSASRQPFSKIIALPP